MRISMLCFSQTGWRTGERLRQGFLGKNREWEVSLDAKSRYVKNSIEESHGAWTKRQFGRADAVIFIGACGIAVRSIAPLVESKKTDPAVLVIDECGKFVISLLSGHLGGANALAAEAAGLLEAIPVITTATDLHRRFAVDIFAAKNGCGIRPMTAAKEVSAALLAGEEVGFYSDFPWEGELPEGLVHCDAAGRARPAECGGELAADQEGNLAENGGRQAAASAGKKAPRTGIAVSIREDCHPFPVTVHIIPKIVSMGIGCRRGKAAENLRRRAEQCLREAGICREALEGLASIDLKKEEPGLLALAEEWKLPFTTFPAEALQQIPGAFSASSFVSSVTGVDNVCERSAVCGSGGGRLIQKKAGAEGVTTALAQREWRIRFE